MREILRAGRTYAKDPAATSEQARAWWLTGPPGGVVVAVDDDGTVLGTARSGPNQEGNGAHVATASFMVDPGASRRGVGRALGEHVLARARAEGFRSMQFNAVVETNVAAVSLWRSLGFEVLATIPEAFDHPDHGLVGLHVMYRRL